MLLPMTVKTDFCLFLWHLYKRTRNQMARAMCQLKECYDLLVTDRGEYRDIAFYCYVILISMLMNYIP
jgi:hypothetical protein